MFADTDASAVAIRKLDRGAVMENLSGGVRIQY
jgi:hypothetical protein